MKTKYGSLTILCNGCGQPMSDRGVWPIQWPRSEENKATQFCTMYTCLTCRIPSKDFIPGYPVIVKIIETELEGANCAEAA